jgi:molybdenum cofactor cytidylyltransferase
MCNIAAVVLAAGGSSRLGERKQLLKFRGETLVRRAVRAASESECDPIVVVVGEIVAAIRDELRASEAIVVENPGWAGGMGTSIRRGLEAVPASVRAVVLLTCDQPLVDAPVLAQLIAARKKTGKPIIACCYANTLGVPALFDRSCFAALLKLPDDSGAKRLIASRADVASIAFEEGAVDVDTPEDFERLNENRG